MKNIEISISPKCGISKFTINIEQAMKEVTAEQLEKLVRGWVRYVGYRSALGNLGVVSLSDLLEKSGGSEATESQKSAVTAYVASLIEQGKLEPWLKASQTAKQLVGKTFESILEKVSLVAEKNLITQEVVDYCLEINTDTVSVMEKLFESGAIRPKKKVVAKTTKHSEF